MTTTLPRIVLLLVVGLALAGLAVSATAVLAPPPAAAHPEPGDEDGDEVRDEDDNCPTTRNGDQLNTDGDEFGDACDNDDDNDSVADAEDNCRKAPNTEQADSNGNGIGDACDRDSDTDGISDVSDNCVDLANADQQNIDGDALGDACDADDDGDGIDDVTDRCPRVPDEDQADADGDGIGSACDDSEARTIMPPPSQPPASEPLVPAPVTLAPDRTAPDLAVRLRRSFRHAELGAGVPVGATCSEACRLTATLVARGVAARRVGRNFAARGTAELGARGRTYVFVRLPRTAARRLRRLRVARLQLTVTAVDAAGNAKTHRQTVRFRR